MTVGRFARANTPLTLPTRHQAQASTPGAVLREDVLPALHMTQGRARPAARGIAPDRGIRA